MDVLLLENRCATEAVALVEDAGHRAFSAPAMQEVPLSRQPELNALVERMQQNNLDVLICCSIGGVRQLLSALEQQGVSLNAANPPLWVVRGTKSLDLLREAGFEPAVIVPEPNTWRELIEALDQSDKLGSLEGLSVALLEAGETNTALVKALVQRKAHVIQVPTYRWALPDDVGPLEKGMQALVDGKLQAVLFSNRSQVQNFLRLAREKGLETSVRGAMRRAVVASIGQKTSAELAAVHLGVDFEPQQARLENFIKELLAELPQLYEQKQSDSPATFRARFPEKPQDKRSIEDSLFMRACRRQAVPRTPVWLMRQAGRYMQEYRKVRAQYSFEVMCKQPEVAAEVTLTAVERIRADASIIFSDILLLAEPLGFHLSYETGAGPVLEGPQNWERSIEALPEAEPRESLAYVGEAIRLTRSGLNPEIPLLGFSAAPFTLAAYLIEGGASKNFVRTKSFMYTEEAAWHQLMEKLVRALVKLLRLQVDAGADALQVFDSWIGALSVDDYRQYVFPHVQQLFAELPAVPTIHFGTGTASLLDSMKEAGGDVIGIDWRTPLMPAWESLGDVAVQGNLDPVVLFSNPKRIRSKVQALLDSVGSKPGHIFNLGHGVLPGTPVENVIALIEMVHEISEKQHSLS